MFRNYDWICDWIYICYFNYLKIKEEKMRRILVLVWILGLLGLVCFGAIETNMIDFSDPVGENPDQTVYIKRDTSDNMVLSDQNITSPVLLSTLVNAGGVSDHGDLTGLGNDDHSQYFNQSRLDTKLGTSESGSGSTYINSLPISGAVGGESTIGGFVADSSIHYKRSGGRAEVAKTNGQFGTIQDGINWIVSTYGTAGGVVHVNPGDYTEQLTLAQNVSLRCEPGVTVKFSTLGQYCLTVPGTATGCEVRGIKFQSTNVTGKTQAVLVVSGGNLVMRDCVIDWDSSVDNDFAIYVAGDIITYDCEATCWDIVLYAAQSCEWNGGRITNTATGGATAPVFIDDGGTGIFRDIIIDANDADSGIFGSTAAVGYLYDVTILDATIDLDGVFGTTFHTAGARYESIGDDVTIVEIIEGRATNLRHYVEKEADATDYAYRYRIDEITKFSVDYEGNIFAAGTLSAANIQGGSQVITVAKSGGDFQTVQAAINSIDDATSITPYVILIYPGKYTEAVELNKSWVSLRGWSNGVIDRNVVRGNVIIQAGPTEKALVIRSGTTESLEGINVSDLTLDWIDGIGLGITLEIGKTGDPSAGQHSAKFENVAIYGRQDTVTVRQSDVVVFKNCYIEGFIDDVTMVDSADFYECEFYCYSTAGGPLPGDFANNLFVGDISSINPVIAKFYSCTFDAASTTSLLGVGRWGSGSYADEVYFYNCAIGSNIEENCWLSEGGTDKIYLSNTNGLGWGVDADFISKSGIKLGDATVPVNGIGSEDDIASSATVRGNDLVSLEIRWKDYSAVSWVGESEWTYTSPNDYLFDASDDAYCYFPIQYEAGTIISKIRVKYAGTAGSDGIDYRVVKRLDSGTATGWTLVGALQQVTNSGVIVDTYDIPDFSIDENYSYSIEIVSVVTVDVKLYSIGIESSLREW